MMEGKVLILEHEREDAKPGIASESPACCDAMLDSIRSGCDSFGGRLVFFLAVIRRHIVRLLLNWVLSAFALWIVTRLVPGFHLSGPAAALIAALVIGFVNATLGFFLKIVTFPFIVLTLGIFWIVINAVMIELASAIVPGFHVDTFGAAFWGAIVLSLVNMLLRAVIGTRPGRD
jgi:putative membrane protein